MQVCAGTAARVWGQLHGDRPVPNLGEGEGRQPFGKETAGLPDEFRLAHYDRCIRIPMRADARSLNLSNSVAILAYEALRQQGFPQLSGVGEMAGGRDGSLPSGAR